MAAGPGGRPKGAKDKVPRRNVSALHRALKSQLAPLPKGYLEPLEIMIERANTPSPMDRLTKEQKEAVSTDPVAVMDLMRTMGEHQRMTLDAANKAAPFRHARLSASESNADDTDQDQDLAALSRLKVIEKRDKS